MIEFLTDVAISLLFACVILAVGSLIAWCLLG
jgi:hypothetical protein